MKLAHVRPFLAALMAALILLSACLCGCTKTEKGFPIALSDPEKSVFEICDDNYKDPELKDIYSGLAEAKNAGALNDAYPIECLRKTDDGYLVLYKGKKKLLALRFDTDANWIEQPEKECMYTIMTTRAFYDSLKVGDNVSEVQKVDKYIYLPFLENPDAPLKSDHYSGDGYVTHILYDEQQNISAIWYEVA